MMQAWLVKGGQSKYSGHCCSFMKDVSKIVEKVPTLPEDLDIAIVHAKTTDNHSYWHPMNLSKSNVNDLPIIFEFLLGFILDFEFRAESIGIHSIHFRKMEVFLIDYEAFNKRKLKVSHLIILVPMI